MAQEKVILRLVVKLLFGLLLFGVSGSASFAGIFNGVPRDNKQVLVIKLSGVFDIVLLFGELEILW